ncbi:MAG: hypothetical protein EBU84_15645, partial [Actinobacteria bacterium]|nr:hypothetical protein [Actinomycetota bacterium]
EASSATITLDYNDGTSETFRVPVDLLPEVTAGQSVARFQPLVTGITVFDKVSSPGFLAREAGLAGVAPFLTEAASRGDGVDTDEQRALKLVEQNTYLPQIDVNAFIRPDIKLSNVKTFLRNIQPKSRTFLLQVLVGTFKEQVLVKEILGQDIAFTVDANLDYNPAVETTSDVLTLAETELNSGLCLDSEVITLGEDLTILVREGSAGPETQVYP